MKQKQLMLLGGLRYLLPVIEEAHKLGVYVITADYLPDNIAHQYSDEYVNVSIIDKDAVLAVAKEKQIDGILSHAVDPGVTTAAYVAEEMRLPFQCSYQAACILQNKALFREFLAENGFNTPKSKGYTNIEDALRDIDIFTWPVIVKPVDSAGSKGVTKVECANKLGAAIEYALQFSLSKRYIIEEFLDVDGFQSSTDIFVVDGKLVYSTFSDQLFDAQAKNPFTPAIEIWPSTMKIEYQNELSNELQRLFNLLDVKTGIYNMECRVAKNGKAYIMEVSPRGGGNRIAELQDMATGQQLIKNEILKSLALPLESISHPQYNGVWCNYILRSPQKGVLESIEIDAEFRNKHIRSAEFLKNSGDEVELFEGANCSLGTLFLQFDSRDKLDQALNNSENWLKINIQ